MRLPLDEFFQRNPAQCPLHFRKRLNCCAAAERREWDGPAALPAPDGSGSAWDLPGSDAPCLVRPPFTQ